MHGCIKTAACMLIIWENFDAFFILMSLAGKCCNHGCLKQVSLYIQWNLLNLAPCKICQDNVAQKFCYVINICLTISVFFPLKMISIVRGTNSSWHTEFCTCLIHLLHWNHKYFFGFSFLKFVANIQESNSALSLSSLISRVITTVDQGYGQASQC